MLVRRRISIHADVDGELLAYDAVVCARTPVAALLPTLVDMVTREAPDGARWRLRSTAGDALDDSASLADNGVHDGDVVVLEAAPAPPHGLLGTTAVHSIADAGGERRLTAARFLEMCWVWLILVVTSGAAWTALREPSPALIATMVCCAVATSWRARVTDSAAMAVAGTLIAGAAAFVVVPAGPAAPNVLLGAAVVFATSVALCRLVPTATSALTAVGAAGALAALTAALTIGCGLPAATAGALLTGGAVVLLAVAPRCAATVTGAHSAHRLLTGLVGGAALSTVGGAALVVCVGSSGIAVAVATAAILLVRVRTYVDGARRLALLCGGSGCAALAVLAVAGRYPGWMAWLTAGVCATLCAAATVRLGPASRRLLDALDYTCTALLIPLACWATGLYGVARDWAIT